MNAYYLHKPDGTASAISMCGACGRLSTDFGISEKCCTCHGCGQPREHPRTGDTFICGPCERKRRADREAAAMEKAVLAPGYAGPVFYEGLTGSYGDGCFSDVEELAERLGDGDSELPEFAFCCKALPYCRLNLEQIVESACEETEVDEAPDLVGIEELQAAVDAFNTANARQIVWVEDRSRKVAMPAKPGG
jgi:hypothetical protein